MGGSLAARRLHSRGRRPGAHHAKRGRGRAWTVHIAQGHEVTDPHDVFENPEYDLDCCIRRPCPHCGSRKGTICSRASQAWASACNAANGTIPVPERRSRLPDKYKCPRCGESERIGITGHGTVNFIDGITGEEIAHDLEESYWDAGDMAWCEHSTRARSRSSRKPPRRSRPTVVLNARSRSMSRATGNSAAPAPGAKAARAMFPAHKGAINGEDPALALADIRDCLDAHEPGYRVHRDTLRGPILCGDPARLYPGASGDPDTGGPRGCDEAKPR